MRNIRRWLMVLLVGWLASSVHAQVARPVAALVNGDVVLFGLDGSARQLTTTGRYRDLVWSPNGLLLAYIGDPTGAGPENIYVVDRGGLGEPFIAATGITSPFPISFTPDSALIIYSTRDPASQAFDVFAVPPTRTGTPSRIARLTYAGGCTDDASADPSLYRYRRESDQQPFMQMTAAGLLHDTSCLDNNQLVLLDLFGGGVTTLDLSGRVFVSPDRTTIVAPRSDRLIIWSRPDSPPIEIRVGGTPDQVGFGGASDIYYSTRALIGPPAMQPATAEQLGTLLYTMPSDYRVSLYRFSLQTGLNELIYEADAFGITRIGGPGDGTTVIFSQIPNPSTWITLYESGTLGSDPAAVLSQLIQRVKPEIVALDLSDGSARRIGTGWERIAVNPASAVTIDPAPVMTALPTATLPPTRTPEPTGLPTLPPSGLAIGVEATVSDGILALNVRERPGTGARVVEVINPGDRVTITDGSIPREGFTWWQVRLASGAVGWVAENVGGVQTIVP